MAYLDYPGLQRYHGKIQGEITELKNDFKNYDSGKIPLFDAVWTRGALNADGSINSNATWRLTTSNILTADRNLVFSLDSGYTGQIATYTSASVFISRGVLTNGYPVPKGTYFRVSVYKSSESTSDNPTDFYKYVHVSNAYVGSYTIFSEIINNSNYSSYISDLNQATENGKVYMIVPSSNAPLNLPSDIKLSWFCVLRVTQVGNAILQELISETGVTYIRFRYNASSWDRWYKIHNSSYTVINNSNYSTSMADLNSVVDSGTYTIVPVSGAMPSHMPNGIKLNWYCTLRVVSAQDGGNGTMQEIISEDGNVYTRFMDSASAWSTWTRNEAKTLFTVATDGSGDYTSVLDAITEAITLPNSVVYVNEGSYDVIQEYKDKYGDTYFDNYSGSSNQYQGINLRNGISLIFSSNAKLVCKYTGNNSLVRQSFSCLNMSYGDAFLYNVTLDCANIRYAVHDDPITNKEYAWRHEYHHCYFKIDYTNEITGINIHGVIGGGLGNQSDIVIEDCVFEMIGYGNNSTGCVGYHNCVNDNSLSRVVIKNNYFKNGTAYATWYGPSTEKSMFLVSGNRVRSEPFARAENVSDYNVENVELLKWNNTVA